MGGQRGYAEPIFLVTNRELPDAAYHWYKKRFRAACLTYLWIIYLGLTAIREDWVPLIHRADRCDWSLFHLGLDNVHYGTHPERLYMSWLIYYQEQLDLPSVQPHARRIYSPGCQDTEKKNYQMCSATCSTW